MKPTPKNSLIGRLSAGNALAISLVLPAAAFFQAQAGAANLTWDANGAATDVTNGAGVWDTTSLNWWNGAINLPWTNGDTAIVGTNPVTGAGATINFTDSVNIAAEGLVIADNGNTANYTLAPPTVGTMEMTIGTGGITANDGVTITQPIILGGNQTWSRSATGNGALVLTETVDDKLVPRNLVLSSALGSATAGIILRGGAFRDGTTTINDGYFQIRHDSLGLSEITLNGTIGGAQRVQFINAAGTGGSGTLSNNIKLVDGKEGNFYVWTGFTTNVTNPITGGNATSVLRKTDGGILLLEGNNPYPGATIVDAGTLQLGNGGSAGAIDFSASLTINGTAVVDVRREGSTNLSDLLPGAAGTSTAPFTAIDGRLNFSGLAQSDTLVIDQDIGTTNVNGQLRVSSGTMSLASGTDLQLRSLSVGHTSLASGNLGTLNVGPGSAVTLATGAVAALMVGDSSGNAGILNINGGSISLPGNNATAAVRIGHWAGTGSQLNISAGSLSVPSGRVNIGWDGEATLNMTGGTLTALAISIDGNGAGPAATANLDGGQILLGGNGLSTASLGTITANGGSIIATTGNTMSVPRTILAGGLTTGFGTATAAITVTDNSVTTGSGPLNIVNLSPTGAKNYTINTNSPLYTGAVAVPAGVRLQPQQANALGTGTVTLPAGAGAYLTNTTAPYPTNFLLAGNGWDEAAGFLGAMRLQGATVSGNVAIAAGGARLTAHSGSNGTLTGTLTGTAPLEINSTAVNNNGTITLAGNGSGFTGPITVSQGRLNVAGSIGGNVSVSGGAFLGGEGVISGSVTLGSATPATLTINPTTAAALAVTGNVTFNGVTPLTFSQAPTSGGTITVFNYSGTLTGTPGTDLVLANAASYRTATWNNTGSAVTLSLANKNLAWTGSASGIWDVGTAANWTDGAASPFFWADNVTFPDAASNTNIAVSGVVSPASMVFPADFTNYTLTATAGAAQVETTTATGDTTADGSIQVTVTATDLPGSPLVIPVAVTTTQTAITWAGLVRTALTANLEIASRFVVGGTSATITLTRRADANGAFLANDTTLNISLENGTPNPGITPAPTSIDTTAGAPSSRVVGLANLFKSGAGPLTLAGPNGFSGGTLLSKGTTTVQASGALGTGTVTLGDAATGAENVSLYLDTNRVNLGAPLVITNNGTGIMTLGSRNTIGGTGDNNQFVGISLQRDVVFDANAADRTDFESISGTGNITVNGTGRAIFMTANTFAGTLTLNNTNVIGLQLGTNSTALNAIPDAAEVTINAGSALSLSYTAGGTETIGGLNGAGTVRQNGGAANTLAVGGGNANGSFSGAINNVAGVISFTKTGTGTQTLSGSASGYTGVTTITAGALEVSTLANGGTASSIGAAPNLPANLVFGAPTATLRYIGNTDVSSDRGFTLNSAVGGGATLESSGNGAWTIASATTIAYGTTAQTRTLTLGGTNPGANTFAPVIANNGTSLTTVTKTGIGTWALTGTSSFTGPLNINGGRLNLGSIGNGGVASPVGQSPRAGVNLQINGGTLAYTGPTAVTDRGFAIGAAGGTIEIPANTNLTFGGTSTGGNFALNGTLTKTGPGTLSLAFYPGSSGAAATDLVINEGVVNFSTSHFNSNPFGFRGLSIVVNAGGILRAPLNDALGGDGSDFGNSLGQIRLLGGEYQLGGRQWLSIGVASDQNGRLVLEGASVTGAGNLRANGSIGSFISSLESATTSVIGVTGGLALDSGPMTVLVGDGDAAVDLRITGPVASPAGNVNAFTKGGAGLLELQGASTFSGPTLITEGSALISAGHLRNTSSVTLSPGTLMEVNASNVFTSGHGVAEAAASPITIDGSTLRFGAGSQCRLGNIILTAGTLTTNQGSGFGNGYDVYLGALGDDSQATVSVTGTAASTINGSGVLRLGNNTVFDVSDANGSGDDLTVSTGFRDQTLDQANAPGGFTKKGPGTMTLTGVSAHTGNTTVESGLLKLAPSGSLRFAPGANGVTNKITGSGAAQFSGSFEILLAGADPTTGNSWVIADTASRTFDASFSVQGFTDPENDNTWVTAFAGKTWSFSESTGVLSVTGTAGFSSWISGFFPLETDPAIVGPAADPDRDGVPNAVEMVLGGDPKNTMDAALLPTIDLVTDPAGLPTGNYLKYTFRRSDLSVAAGVASAAQYNTDLLPAWIPAVNGVDGVVILTTNDGFGAGMDRVEVFVPRGINAKLFGRLSVLVP